MINTWQEFLKLEKEKDYYKKIVEFVIEERKNNIIYPEDNNIFNSFRLTPLNKVKCVIIGADPYINPNQAMGLAFSVPDAQIIPPSLKNIFQELKNDLGIENTNGNLTSWAKQGVFLLNSILTVRAGKSNSHANIGWENLTDGAIKLINERDVPVVFVCWGNHAKKKKEFITNAKNLTIENVHPSPRSAHRGYFGSKPFSKINEFLKKNDIEEINWKT